MATPFLVLVLHRVLSEVEAHLQVIQNNYILLP